MSGEPDRRAQVYLAAAAIVLGLVGVVLAVLQNPWASALPAAGLICVAASLALRDRG